MFDWMMPVYKVLGANYPRISLVAMCCIGAVVFGGWWWLTGREYRERFEKQNPAQVEKSSTEQLAEIEIREHRERAFDDKVRAEIIHLVPSATNASGALRTNVVVTDGVVRRVSETLQASEAEVRESVKRQDARREFPWQ